MTSIDPVCRGDREVWPTGSWMRRRLWGDAYSAVSGEMGLFMGLSEEKVTYTNVSGYSMAVCQAQSATVDLSLILWSNLGDIEMGRLYPWPVHRDRAPSTRHQFLEVLHPRDPLSPSSTDGDRTRTGSVQNTAISPP